MASKKKTRQKKKGVLASLMCCLSTLFCCVAPPAQSSSKNKYCKQSVDKAEDKTSEGTQCSSPPSTPGDQHPSGSSGCLSGLSPCPSVALGVAVGSHSESAITGHEKKSSGDCKETVSDTHLHSASKDTSHSRSWPVVSSVRASFHQGSTTLFGSLWSGSQCTTMSLVAVALSTVKAIQTWNRDDLDHILFSGHNVHGRTLASLGRTDKKSNQKVGVCELIGRCVDVAVNGSRCSMVGFSSNEAFGMVSSKDPGLPNSEEWSQYGMVSLAEALQKALHGTDGAVLTVGEYSTGIIQDPEGSLRVFDSHSRGPGGLMHPAGRAVLTKVEDLDDLTNFVKLQLLQQGRLTEPFDVVGFKRVL